MNLSQLKSLVSYWVDDLDLAYFTPAQVTTFLNNAQKSIQKDLILCGEGFYLKCVQTTLVINQREYVLPEDFMETARLEIVVSGTAPTESLAVILPITPQQKDLIYSQQSIPIGYYLQKNRIVMFPAPDQTYVFRLYYQYQIPDMVLDTDTPDIPDAYQEMIALLAAYDCLIKDGRDVGPLSAKIDKYRAQMKDQMAERLADKSRTVIETGTYMQDSGYWGY